LSSFCGSPKNLYFFAAYQKSWNKEKILISVFDPKLFLSFQLDLQKLSLQIILQLRNNYPNGNKKDNGTISRLIGRKPLGLEQIKASKLVDTLKCNGRRSSFMNIFFMER